MNASIIVVIDLSLAEVVCAVEESVENLMFEFLLIVHHVPIPVPYLCRLSALDFDAVSSDYNQNSSSVYLANSRHPCLHPSFTSRIRVPPTL